MFDGLGDRLRQARVAAGFGDSLRDAEERLRSAGIGTPVSHSTIADHENETPLPRADQLLCYAAAWRVHPMWLLTGKGEIEWSPRETEAEDPEVMDARFRMWMGRIGRWLEQASEGAILPIPPDDDSVLVTKQNPGRARKKA